MMTAVRIFLERLKVVSGGVLMRLLFYGCVLIKGSVLFLHLFRSLLTVMRRVELINFRSISFKYLFYE